jgi:para-nitrobenzyl esterase
MSSLTKAFSEVTLLSFAVFAACEGPTTQPGIVKLDSGRISGQSGEVYRYYLGIPFAAPPVGELRGKPPQRVKSWTGIRECTEFGPACSKKHVIACASP